MKMKNMPQIIDLTGHLFGRLKVLECAGRYNRRTYWICRCECGCVGKYEGGNLQQGFTTKCRLCRYKFFKRKEAKKLRHQGQSQTIKEWSEELDLAISTIQSRLSRGHSVKKVLFAGQLPPSQGRRITFRGETKSLRQWAQSLSISIQALKMRLNNWTETDALTLPNTRLQRNVTK